MAENFLVTLLMQSLGFNPDALPADLEVMLTLLDQATETAKKAKVAQSHAVAAALNATAQEEVRARFQANFLTQASQTLHELSRRMSQLQRLFREAPSNKIHVGLLRGIERSLIKRIRIQELLVRLARSEPDAFFVGVCSHHMHEQQGPEYRLDRYEKAADLLPILAKLDCELPPAETEA